MRDRTPVILTLMAFVSAAFAIAGGHTPGTPVLVQESQDLFGGSYLELEPQQQELFAGFVDNYNGIMGTSLVADVAYDDLPASTRTTFDAITDALAKTTLTDAAGASLGTTLDLIAGLERVNGAILGAGGDLQFRAYVELTPNARQVLDQSVEFSRQHDNTHFHKGYPLNYRLDGGPPSLQFSMTADASLADIDVDYRSSRIPQVLWDGHLTVANSDVRAGNNYDRHVGRWEGLANWWRNIFGFFEKETDFIEGAAEPDTSILTPIPVVPRIAPGSELSATVADFLEAWLVEGNPAQALAHLSVEAYPCVLELQEHAESDEMAPLFILQSMERVKAHLGDVARLSDVVAPLPVPNVRMTQVRHENDDIFTLVRIPPSPW